MPVKLGQLSGGLGALLLDSFFLLVGQFVFIALALTSRLGTIAARPRRAEGAGPTAEFVMHGHVNHDRTMVRAQSHRSWTGVRPRMAGMFAAAMMRAVLAMLTTRVMLAMLSMFAAGMVFAMLPMFAAGMAFAVFSMFAAGVMFAMLSMFATGVMVAALSMFAAGVVLAIIVIVVFLFFVPAISVVVAHGEQIDFQIVGIAHDQCFVAQRRHFAGQGTIDR